MTETIKGFKGFDKDLKCRGYQYEVGQYFQEEGKIEACSKGFHFCENPFDVFSYYPPSSENGINRYCVVEGGGSIDKDSDDTKIACSKLHISAEIGLKGLVEAGVKFILDKVNWKDCKTCSLCSICYKNLLIDKLCDIKVQKGISYKFVNQGKVTNIKIDKED